MLLFTIKKAFFDIWDNMFTIMFLNLGGMIIVAGGLSLLELLKYAPLLVLLGLIATAAVLSLYIGAASMIARDITDYKPATVRNFLRYFKETWKVALFFFGTLLIQYAAFSYVLPWYFKMGGIFGLFAIGILFWTIVAWWFASQYYFPIRSRLDHRLKDIVAKSFALFFDNIGFSVALGVGTVVLSLLAVLTVFIFFGLGAILVWHQVGFKLRMYKYAYLEKHPEASKKYIPWETLLRQDRERVGKRTLRQMIFPWKE